MSENNSNSNNNSIETILSSMANSLQAIDSRLGATEQRQDKLEEILIQMQTQQVHQAAAPQPVQPQPQQPLLGLDQTIATLQSLKGGKEVGIVGHMLEAPKTVLATVSDGATVMHKGVQIGLLHSDLALMEASQELAERYFGKEVASQISPLEMRDALLQIASANTKVKKYK
jgi:hypothetical protein